MLPSRALLLSVFLAFPMFIFSKEHPTGAACIDSSLSDKCGGLADLCTTDGLCTVIEGRCAIEADTQQDCVDQLGTPSHDGVVRDLDQDAHSATSWTSNSTQGEEQEFDPDNLLAAAADADGYDSLGGLCIAGSRADKCGGVLTRCTSGGKCVYHQQSEKCDVDAAFVEECAAERQAYLDMRSSTTGPAPDPPAVGSGGWDDFEGLGERCVAGALEDECGDVLEQCTPSGLCTYNRETRVCQLDEGSAEECVAAYEARLGVRSPTAVREDAPAVGAGGWDDFEGLGERCVAGALEDECGGVLEQCTPSGLCTYNRETRVCETDPSTQQRCMSGMEDASASTAFTRAWRCAEAELRDAEGRMCMGNLRQHLYNFDASWRRNRTAGEMDPDSGMDKRDSNSNNQETESPAVAWSADALCQRRCVARSMDVLPFCWSVATAPQESASNHAEAANNSSSRSGRHLSQQAPEQAADDGRAADVGDVAPATGQSQRAAEAFARDHLARVVQWCSAPNDDGSRRWRDDQNGYEPAGSDAAVEAGAGAAGSDGSYSGTNVVRSVLACAAQASDYNCERELRYVVDEVDRSMSKNNDSDDESDSDSWEGGPDSAGAWPAARRERAEVCVSRCMNEALKTVPACWESVVASTRTNAGRRHLAQNSHPASPATPAANASTQEGERADAVRSSVAAVLSRMAKRCARANNQQMDEWLGSSEDASSTDLSVLMWHYVNRCAMQKTAVEEDAGGSMGVCTRPLRQLAEVVESDLRQLAAEQGGAGRGGGGAGWAEQCECPCPAEDGASPAVPAPTRRLLMEKVGAAAAVSRRGLQQEGPEFSQPQSEPGQNADDAASQASESVCACACDGIEGSTVPFAGGGSGEAVRGRHLLQPDASPNQDADSVAPSMCDDRCMEDANRILPQCWEEALEIIRSDSATYQDAYDASTGMLSGASGRRLLQRESNAASAGQQNLAIGARNISASLLRIQARCANGDQQTTQTPAPDKSLAQPDPAQVGSEDTATRESDAQNVTTDANRPTDSPTVSSQDMLRLAFSQPNGSESSLRLASSVMAGFLVSVVLLGV